MASTFRKKTEYHRVYSHMRGVDLSGDGSAVSTDRFAYLENLWRDYGGDDAGTIESVVGFRRLHTFAGAVHAIYRQRTEAGDRLLIHAGDGLYGLPLAAMDTAEPTRLADMRDADSCAFAAEDRCYVFDGERMIGVYADGAAGVVGTDLPAYTPTTYENGHALEQRNFLNEYCYESYTLDVPELLSYGSYGLVYEPDPDNDGAVRVCGLGSAYDTRVYIPNRVQLSGVTFSVSGIAPRAFVAADALRELHIAQGVEFIGEYACANCSELRVVVMKDSLHTIGAHAFDGCTALSEVYFGAGLMQVDTDAFAACPSTVQAGYALDEYHLSQVIGVSNIGAFEMLYNFRRTEMFLEIPVCSVAEDITQVLVDDADISYDLHRETVGVVGVNLFFTDAQQAYGKTVRLKIKLARDDGSVQNGQHSFFTSHPSYAGTSADVITRSTVCACFDGRIFVSGNPTLPGMLFYSQRTRYGVIDPTYFGVLNYVTDGIGRSPIVSLLPTAGALVVLKAEDDGGGSIFYHTPQSTADGLLQTLYPVAYTHMGLRTYGASASFMDDAVFVTPAGLLALDRQNLALERSIAVRSHMVAGRLLCEELSRARLAIWCGYLVLSVDGRMYLADSRQTFRHSSGYMEYEWYLLSGIGTYAADSTVYRYASVAHRGYTTSDTPDAVAQGSVNTNSTYPYIIKGGKFIEVYATAERQGGTFSPAGALLGFDEYLFFGTDSGALCVFNNDMRGMAPAHIRASEGFDAQAYRRINGRRIHPDYYDFDGHAMRCALRTAADNVGIPHMTKSTVRGSLALKCRTVGTHPLTVEVSTDRHRCREVTTFPSGSTAFDDLDFSCFTFETDNTFTVPLREQERRWIEKQICLYCDAFRSPIGIYSVAYRFTIHGNIKGR